MSEAQAATFQKILLVIDIQREYTLPFRPLHISAIGASLQKAYRLLQFARNANWPIVHIRRHQEGELFNLETGHADFVDGFVPILGEAQFVKQQASCFSSPEFERYMQAHRDNEIVVMGYTSADSCLATLQDAQQCGYHCALVTDASACRATEGMSEEIAHQQALLQAARIARLTCAEDEMAILQAA